MLRYGRSNYVRYRHTRRHAKIHGGTSQSIPLRFCGLRGAHPRVRGKRVRFRASKVSGETTDFLCDFDDASDLRRLAKDAAFFPGPDQLITGWKRAFSGSFSDATAAHKAVSTDNRGDDFYQACPQQMHRRRSSGRARPVATSEIAEMDNGSLKARPIT
jgi:hypothetical protein